MPPLHTVDYYREAVLEHHDVYDVYFDTVGFGQISVSVLPLDSQQDVVDWLNAWGGRAAYLCFYPMDEEFMFINIHSINKHLRPAGFEVKDKVANTLVIQSPTGGTFDVEERELLSAGGNVVDFIKQVWEARGEREPK